MDFGLDVVDVLRSPPTVEGLESFVEEVPVIGNLEEEEEEDRRRSLSLSDG